MSTAESSGDALERMRSLYGAEQSEACVDLATQLWARHGPEADACLGECWRFAMIASRKLGLASDAMVWRSRARSAFARAGCHNGTALAMLPDFFTSLDSFPATPATALAVLDAIAATIGGPDYPISSKMAGGIVLEKRGYLRATIGSETDDRELVAAAHADYDEALAATTDLRRRLKIRAGRTSVRYLLATTAKLRIAAIGELQEIIAEATEAGTVAVEVVRVGRINLERMSAERRDLEPYEVL